MSIVLIYDLHDFVLPDFDLDLAAPPREFAIPATTPDGFDIVAFCDRKGARVCFGGLECDFEDTEEAAEWVKRALSERFRLRIDFVGKRPFRWALEELQPGGAVREWLVSGYTVLRRSLRKRRTIYRQNHRAAP